ncbi:MAG: hypothetical protein V4629_07695 [Pseudomonadota bacterium]
MKWREKSKLLFLGFVSCVLIGCQSAPPLNPPQWLKPVLGSVEVEKRQSIVLPTDSRVCFSVGINPVYPVTENRAEIENYLFELVERQFDGAYSNVQVVQKKDPSLCSSENSDFRIDIVLIQWQAWEAVRTHHPKECGDPFAESSDPTSKSTQDLTLSQSYSQMDCEDRFADPRDQVALRATIIDTHQNLAIDQRLILARTGWLSFAVFKPVDILPKVVEKLARSFSNVAW